MKGQTILNHWQALLNKAIADEDACIELMARAALTQGLDTQRYGDLDSWLDAMERLNQLGVQGGVELADSVAILSGKELSPVVEQEVRVCLEALIPWRKGPFTVGKIEIDSEWRSDLKWDRIANSVDWRKKKVLDIGCGNGYHALRAYGAGACEVIGIDPSPRFLVQFYMLLSLIRERINVSLLPFTLEAMDNILAESQRRGRPANFDITMSMGVLYHRKDPFGHLQSIAKHLQKDGELILETLVIEGDERSVLVPKGRYAMMNNVWCLPSVSALSVWAEKCGFYDVRHIDSSITSLDEQRTTAWMRFHSLSDFLDPNDQSKTLEGHPAPQRAILKMKRA